jgi:hypothetical protein
LNLIESFKINESLLNSAIGNTYGDIYEAQLEWAKNSRLNKEGDQYLHSAHKKYMRPFYTSKL